ncbi:sporulation integral membrane protein YtvI [Halobacillus salinarum]|uniref:Sporulation integral membrane protein YtvI n=1 Tax=Halobacillus salinarum TaxID=2932257 RepID=A0ABY4EP57_9BACI|nr:sporulation integral membrane protein YtvI [Halobacillus salinarum]UOQ46170.1 sporulation integral membrane protein YtvI [Halobacillus salinarum]
MDKHVFYQALRFLVVLVCVILSGTFVYFSWNYLYPFLFALLFAWILHPFVKILEVRMRLPRWLAVVLLMLLGISFIGGIALLIVAELVKGIQYAAGEAALDFPALINQLIDGITKLVTPAVRQLENFLHSLNAAQKHSVETSLEMLSSKVSSTLSSFAQTILEGLTKGIITIPNSLSTMFIAVLATFFFCKDWEKIITAVRQLLPATIQKTGEKIYEDLKRTVRGMIKAQMILIAVSFVIVFFGLLVMKHPHPLSLAMVTGAVDLLPYIGTGIIFVPWILFEFFSGNFDITIGLAMLYMVLVIVRQLLEPKLLADHFGVPPSFF